MTAVTPHPLHPTTHHTQLGLQIGPHWSSFEDLRVKHAEKLGQITPGTFGTLKVKRRNFVIVDESDFQKFEDVMAQLEHMLERFELVSNAAEAAAEHADEKTIRTLRSSLELTKRYLDKFVHETMEPFTAPKPS